MIYFFLSKQCWIFLQECFWNSFYLMQSRFYWRIIQVSSDLLENGDVLLGLIFFNMYVTVLCQSKKCFWFFFSLKDMLYFWVWRMRIKSLFLLLTCYVQVVIHIMTVFLINFMSVLLRLRLHLHRLHDHLFIFQVISILERIISSKYNCLLIWLSCTSFL